MTETNNTNTTPLIEDDRESIETVDPPPSNKRPRQDWEVDSLSSFGADATQEAIKNLKHQVSALERRNKELEAHVAELAASTNKNLLKIKARLKQC